MPGAGVHYQFDQRPGALEATRGCDSRGAPALIAVGRRGPDGWGVALLKGAVVVAELAPEDAMRLSIAIAHATGLVTMQGLAADDDAGDAS